MKKKYLLPIGIYLFLLIIFNSFLEYVLSKALTSSFLNIYIYKSSYPLLTLYVIPILLFLSIIYILGFVYKNIFNDFIILSITVLILLRVKNIGKILTEHNLVLNYIIIVILLIIPPIYIFYKYYKEYKSVSHNGKKLNFVDPDKAVVLIEDNKRDDFLHLINNFEDIIKQHNNDSLSLAITGEWGSGKTSFINMLKIKLEKTNNYKIINFYPWRCENPESITITFFNLLADALDNISKRKNIKKYLTLIGAETNTALRSLLLLFGSNNLNNIYDLISVQLKKSEKKLIVFIDDVDRLEKNEILSVLKILRNAENFDNIIFITALDEKYVRKTIEKPESYIEKFFQYKRFIPPINYLQKNEILMNLFERNIKPIVENDAIIDKYWDALIKQRELNWIYSPTRKDLSLTYYLTNIREMKKFVSKLTITIKQLKSLADIIKSLKDYNGDTFNFKFLDASILNEDQIIILTMILIKYPHLIRFEQSYLDNLKNAIINQKTKEANPQKENPEVSQNNFSITEFNEIFKNPEIACLFSLFFKKTISIPERGKANIENSLFLFFENYSKYSMNKDTILKYEFSQRLDHLDTSEDLNIFSNNILLHPIFNNISQDQMYLIYNQISRAESEHKFKLLFLFSKLYEQKEPFLLDSNLYSFSELINFIYFDYEDNKTSLHDEVFNNNRKIVSGSLLEEINDRLSIFLKDENIYENFKIILFRLLFNIDKNNDFIIFIKNETFVKIFLDTLTSNMQNITIIKELLKTDFDFILAKIEDQYGNNNSREAIIIKELVSKFKISQQQDINKN